MKREPTIHITRGALNKILTRTFLNDEERAALVDKIMVEARSYSIRHRSLLESNAKITQRASKIKSASKGDALLFSRTYVMIRRSLKHNGITPITDRDGVQWEYVVQAAGLATQFARDIGESDLKLVYDTYIRLALKVLKPFSLNRFKSGDEKIRSEYTAYAKMVEDPNKDTTELLYEIYQAKVAEKTGLTLNYREIPTEYSHFVDAALIAKELDIHPKYFMTAQFDQLDWTNGYPTPSQLSSFKAKERAIRWMAENKIKMKVENKKRSKLQEAFFKRHANKDNT